MPNEQVKCEKLQATEIWDTLNCHLYKYPLRDAASSADNVDSQLVKVQSILMTSKNVKVITALGIDQNRSLDLSDKFRKFAP